MSEYGTNRQTLGKAIRQARVNRIRAADLERWGSGVMALEAKLEAMEQRLAKARGLIEDVGGRSDWADRAAEWLSVTTTQLRANKMSLQQWGDIDSPLDKRSRYERNTE